MDKYYPHDTQRRLKEAKDAFDRLQSAKNPSELKRAVLTFLEQTTLSLFPLNAQGSKIENYPEWWS